MLTYDEYAALSLTSSSLKISRIIAFLVETEIVIMNFSASTLMPKSIDIKVVTCGGNFFCTYMCYFVTIWYCIGFMGRNSVAFFVYLHKEKLTKLWIR